MSIERSGYKSSRFKPYHTSRRASEKLGRWGISLGSKILFRTQPNRLIELDWCKSVGANMIRIDCLAGQESALDAIIPAANGRGLQVMLILYGTTDPISPDSYGHDMALRYGTVKFWEICNEPDWQDNAWTANQYADFVVPTAASIKSGNPDAKIIAGALWKGPDGTPNGTLSFTQALIDRAAGSFDYISWHMYDNPLDRGDWNLWDAAYPWIPDGYYNGQTARERLDAAGMQSIQLISTEGGGPIPDPYSLAQQATVVENNLQQVTDGKIASTAIYTMENDDVTGFGLLDDSLTPRLSYTAFLNHSKPA